MYLKDKDEELVAAYKILAFLKGFQPINVLIEPLSFTMGKYNEHIYGWWSANSKYVLPPCQNYSYAKKAFTDKDWKDIVNQAAVEWKSIANEWQIIWIPDYMDPKSEEYKSFEKLSNQKYEEQEFQKYLILKEKYENK